VQADDSLVATAAIEIDDNLVAVFFHADAFGLEPDVDPFVFEDFRDGFGDVFIFALNQARPHLDDGNLAVEAAVYLTKL
jgi:hypothetical protein